MTGIFGVFSDFPEEAAIVGRLLASYSSLELSLLNCISQAEGDFNGVLKAMFRPRGETRRIEIAVDRGRTHYEAHDLETEFDEAIEALRYCLRIRNQYSHWVWWNNNSGKLAFANLEDVAKFDTIVINLNDLEPQFVDVPLLQEQQVYFNYTDDLLNYVNFEGRHRAGKITNPYPRPKERLRPRLSLPD